MRFFVGNWWVAGAIQLAVATAVQGAGVESRQANCLFNDSHLHLTNYVQQGTDIRRYMDIMGDKICRSTLFGIPLQQTWSYENSGDLAPTYYLQTDAPLYYYSFTDAFIASAYRSLPAEARVRLDPMITGFNPADMYAVDHIRRVLTVFPGVFSGIGEFSVHKEFVSSKVAGATASLNNPALDRILDFAAEAGLVVILHNDIDVPFAKAGAEVAYLSQVKDLLRRHPQTTIIWAHTGLGRVVHPAQSQATSDVVERSPRHFEIIETIIQDPTLSHVYFDISWDEVAKYAVATPETVRFTATMLNRHPDRFLFGTDNVAPQDQETQMRVYHLWDPIWAQLTADASVKIRMGNYVRLFDAARARVRAWESRNLK